MKKIVIIDGQGGRMGSLIAERLRAVFSEAQILPKGYELFGIGTNGIATAAMLKAGADYGATGENPVLVNVRDADLVIGPIGILSADSLFGEVTPRMAVAVAQSDAEKVLLPVNKCRNHIVGIGDKSLSALVEEAVAYAAEYFS